MIGIVVSVKFGDAAGNKLGHKKRQAANLARRQLGVRQTQTA
jgi:hypothetical protein